jgi:hypothetical protein
MSRLILIGCGKTKANEACGARDLYTGSLFSARRAYAERTGCPWWIVSAKHGLVAPDDWLSPYDMTIADLKPVDRAAWALAVVASILDNLGDDTELRRVVVELHMGAAYADPLMGVILAVGMTHSWPVQSMGIGEQRAWYASPLRHLLGVAA